MALNPNGKFLAVAGAFQVAVIVLPRPGFARLEPSNLDCKYARMQLCNVPSSDLVYVPTDQ